MGEQVLGTRSRPVIRNEQFLRTTVTDSLRRNIWEM